MAISAMSKKQKLFKSLGGLEMPKSKWYAVKDRFLEVEAWARDGLTDQQISHNLGIHRDTFYNYKKEHSDFSDALRDGKEVADIVMENAMYKRGTGYTYDEVTTEITTTMSGKELARNFSTYVMDKEDDFSTIQNTTFSGLNDIVTPELFLSISRICGNDGKL